MNWSVVDQEQVRNVPKSLEGVLVLVGNWFVGAVPARHDEDIGLAGIEQ